MKFKEIKDKWNEADQEVVDDYNCGYSGIQETVAQRLKLTQAALGRLLNRLIEDEENNSKPV